MAAYLGYTLRMKMLFRGWPVMVNDTHTRRKRRSLADVSLTSFQPLASQWEPCNSTHACDPQYKLTQNSLHW